MPLKLSTPRFTTKPAFDPVVKRCAPEVLSFTEEDALRDSMWELGEDGHLREDMRFRQTPWGRWILAERFLANHAVYRSFHRDGRSERAVSEALQEVADEMGRKSVFCPADPRFTLRDGMIRLVAAELSDQPRIEDATELEKYHTHLPLHTLTAVAASEPAGEWGARRQEEMIQTLGWVKVDLPGHGINERMFVARIKGHSMDNGHNGLKDGALAVFELWPKGSRSGRRVLMRGGFSDPEFGSYTFKRYEAEERDENRERTTIRLVSLNPDKERYPDILLTTEDAPNLEVLAELLDPLTPDRYARMPKPLRRKGRRDLTSEEGRQRIQRNLDKALERFFQAEAKKPREAEDRSGWVARLVCLDLEAGAMHVETDPLNGFPRFVKRLQLIAGDSVQSVIAANLCSRIWRTPVRPSHEGYRWTAPGFESEVDEDLGKLSITGLPLDRITVFRVDTAGVGRLVSGSILSPGQSYRMVLPAVIAAGVSVGEAVPLGKDWCFWELTIPSQVPAVLVQALKALGIELSKTVPCLEWIGTPPSRYDANTAGESYPVFGADHAPVLRVSGIETRESGELTLFVGGEGNFEMIELPAGDSWWVRMEGIAPGTYIAEVAHKRTSIARARVPFRVVEDPTTWLTCNVSLLLGQEQHQPNADGVIELDCDLSAAFGDESERGFTIQAPVFRRVAAFWGDGKRRRIADLYVDESGRLDVAASCPPLADLIARNPLANLELDLGELGIIRLLHRKEIAVPDLLSKLRDHFDKKGSNAETLRGQYPLLRALWLDPLLSLLYHGVRELDESHLLDLPAESGAAVILAEKLSREGKQIVRRPCRVIVIAPNEHAVLNGKDAGFWELADQACRKTGLTEAVLTDGFVWGLHSVGRKVQPGIIDLRDAVQEGHEGIFEQFLYSHAVTV
jgi:hypothetical protein